MTITQFRSPVEKDLRLSVEVQDLALAIAKADYAQRGSRRWWPARLMDLPSHERDKYQHSAIAVLMSLNPAAVGYAEQQVRNVTWQFFEQFCRDEDLDWASTHAANADDAVEMAITRIGVQAARCYRQVLSMIRPGLSTHLERAAIARATDSEPVEAS